MSWQTAPGQTKIYSTKREVAVEKIRNAIETGFYQPGQVISQRQIGEDFGLSITPVREAIIQLAATGLIERHSHHSIKVTAVDPQRLREIYYVRQILEEEAVKLAFHNIDGATIDELKEINAQLHSLIGSNDVDRIQSLDRHFHFQVFVQARNEALISAIEFIRMSFSVYALWPNDGRLATSVAEHARFIQCLEANDLPGCVRAHRTHLESGLQAATEGAGGGQPSKSRSSKRIARN